MPQKRPIRKATFFCVVPHGVSEEKARAALVPFSGSHFALIAAEDMESTEVHFTPWLGFYFLSQVPVPHNGDVCPTYCVLNGFVPHLMAVGP